MSSDPLLGSAGRSTTDRLRCSALADAANGYPGATFLDWLRRAGADVTAALDAWGNGQLAEVPVGHPWDVVRLPKPAGWRAVQHMRTVDASLGPVLHTACGVEVLVPVDSATAWDLPGAVVLRLGERIAVPHPAIVAPHTQCAKTWIVAPSDDTLLTDASDLYGAYAAVLLAAQRGSRQ